MAAWQIIEEATSDAIESAVSSDNFGMARILYPQPRRSQTESKRVSRQSEKILFEQSRKFLLTP